jgi:hypothetical protein
VNNTKGQFNVFSLIFSFFSQFWLNLLVDKPPNSHHKIDTTKHWQNFIVREFHKIEKRKKKEREKGIEFF